MDQMENTCRSFISDLASSAPTPGGGGAAAFVGAIGTALGNMVGALSIGKKKYASVEPELREMISASDEIQKKLLDQVKADADCFAPLAAAYSMTKDDPQRESVLENATLNACTAPLEIMRLCTEAIDVIAVFSEKGSKLAISDAGCAAVICKAALQAASLNVFINTKCLKNREIAEKINNKAESYLLFCNKADEIYAFVRSKM